MVWSVTMSGGHRADHLGARSRRIAEHADETPLPGAGRSMMSSASSRIRLSGRDNRSPAAFDAAGRHSIGQHAAPCHGGGQRLRAAHAAEPAGQDPFAGQVAAEVLAARSTKVS